MRCNTADRKESESSQIKRNFFKGKGMGLISDVLNRTHGHRLIELIILIDSPRRIDLIGNDFSGDENNDN